MPGSDPIAFFAHERGDARVVKRIAALGDHGRRVLGFTFHRVRDKADVPPAWDNVHLGTTYNRRYFQRLWALARSLGILWKNRRRLGGCGALYAINMDNAVLALAGRWLAGRRIPLVLEIADIQPAILGNGPISQILRAVERRVLARTDLLVTTSPGFVREYFEPVQKFRGEIFLLENKVYPARGLPAAPGRTEPVAGGRPWTIGCFGALRCRRSLRLMRELVEKSGGRVRVILRGYPAGTLADEFLELLGAVPGFEFGGPYAYPEELAEMYGEIDFNWAFDWTDPNGNSAWLLPNRIYEGGCFGVPVLGAKGTETGRWIEERGLGWALEEPLEANLAAFLEKLTITDWQEVKRRCAGSPRAEFTAEGDYAALAERIGR